VTSPHKPKECKKKLDRRRFLCNIVSVALGFRPCPTGSFKLEATFRCRCDAVARKKGQVR